MQIRKQEQNLNTIIFEKLNEKSLQFITNISIQKMLFDS